MKNVGVYRLPLAYMGTHNVPSAVLVSLTVVTGKCISARYLVGWYQEPTVVPLLARYLFGREWDNRICSVTVWMGMGGRSLLGNGLDGIGTCDFAR